MVKNHLKRMAAPQTWAIGRKKTKFVTRPRGYLKTGMPVAIILGEILNVSSTRKETKRIVQNGKISIDGKTVKDERLPLVLLSVIKIEGEASYRMLLNKRGKLFLKKLKGREETSKPCKVTSKKTVKKGKTQLGFHDGTTLLTDNQDVKVNDTLMFSLPGMKAGDHLKLEKGARVYLAEGSNVGSAGTVESVGNAVTVKVGDRIVETGKNSVFVIGDTKVDEK